MMSETVKLPGGIALRDGDDDWTVLAGPTLTFVGSSKTLEDAAHLIANANLGGPELAAEARIS